MFIANINFYVMGECSKRKPTHFTGECRVEDNIKNWNEKNENSLSYAACGFQKLCFGIKAL